MAVNKNFVVKNGLEVNQDLILANASTRRVGIGTTTPQYTLDVRGGIGVTNFYAVGFATFTDRLNVGTNGNIFTARAFTGSTGVGIGTTDPAIGSNALHIYGNQVITNGKVGIGTTTPLYALTVTDTTSTTTGLTGCLADFTTNTNSYGQINIRNQSSGSSASGDVIITADNGTDATNFVDFGINNSGYSVGTWSVNGINDAYLYTSDGSLSIGIGTTNSAKYLSFFVGGTTISNERVRVTQTGVGIGTTSPTSRLHVIGDALISGVTTSNAYLVGATQVISSARQLQNIASLDATTTATIESAIANAPNTFTDITVSGVSTFVGLATFNNGLWVVSGVTTLGVATATNLTLQQLNVSGLSTFAGITTVTGATLFSRQLNVSGVSTLGITTATNLSLQQLNVSGASTFTNGPVLIGTATSTGTTATVLQVAGINSSVYIGGSVGIGTTNPTRKVHIFGDASNNQFNAAISVNSANTTGYGAYLGINATSFTSGRDYRLVSSGSSDTAGVGKFSIYDVTANADRFTIDSSGNIGLGSTNPTTKLDVNGNVRVIGVVTATSFVGSGASLTGNARNLTATIGIGTSGGAVGYGVSFLDLRGPGLSTVFYNGNVGIATIFFQGGGSGSASIGIGTTPGEAFPGIVTTGNLWYNNDIGRLFIYYQDTDSFQWVDASPNTIGITNFDSITVGAAVTINSSGINAPTGIITAIDFNSLSDQNYKENVITVNDALDKVEQLRGVKFDWKESGLPSYGVIAQELEQVLPELVHGNDPKTVNYNGIIGVLIEAIKELKAEINTLKDRIGE